MINFIFFFYISSDIYKIKSPVPLIENKNQIQENEEEEEEKKDNKNKKKEMEKEKKPLTFPWWFRIIALILSYICMIVCGFFIVVKGLEFGNEKVTRWATSLVISFFTSVLLHEPIKV
jgi:hypothetical protein